MALSKIDKKALIDSYTKNIQESTMFFILKPQGITPVEASEFKKQLYDNQSSFNVVKNSLFKIALKEAKNDVQLDPQENGVVFSAGDISQVAKLIEEFIKSTKKAEFIKGYVEGQEITEDEFKSLVNLPSREVLLAQVLSGMQGPISGFVRVLGGNISGFLNVVNAIKDKKS